ncbi:MAG TPA: HesA/MoeB/ThiF family protein [Usitatibacteraceae bacterium]|nr:HesA/MoeB/ThiF family protein [Usitatibacteraceae bacterium]
MDDRALLRYSRHLLLEEFGIEAQQRLLESRALIVGAGGLGAAASLYLASAGVGAITIADGDNVDLTNLQRQVVHNESRLGCNKAQSAAETLRQINSDIVIAAFPARLSGELDAAVRDHDIVLDCSDNFSTRHAINRACVQHSKPLVSGAAIRFDGQVTTFDLRHGGNPCYHCLFPDQPGGEEERCAIMGVFAPLVGIIGTVQAAEALRLLGGIGQTLVGRLLMLDARTMTWQEVRFGADPACAVCSGGFADAGKLVTELDHETQ